MNLISFYEYVRCGLWASSGPFPLLAHYRLYKRGRDPPQTLAVIWRKKGVISLSNGCSRKAGEGVQPPHASVPPPPPSRRPPPLLAPATDLVRHLCDAAVLKPPPLPPLPPPLVAASRPPCRHPLHLHLLRSSSSPCTPPAPPPGTLTADSSPPQPSSLANNSRPSPPRTSPSAHPFSLPNVPTEPSPIILLPLAIFPFATFPLPHHGHCPLSPPPPFPAMPDLPGFRNRLSHLLLYHLPTPPVIPPFVYPLNRPISSSHPHQNSHLHQSTCLPTSAHEFLTSRNLVNPSGHHLVTFLLPPFPSTFTHPPPDSSSTIPVWPSQIIPGHPRHCISSSPQPHRPSSSPQSIIFTPLPHNFLPPPISPIPTPNPS